MNIFCAHLSTWSDSDGVNNDFENHSIIVVTNKLQLEKKIINCCDFLYELKLIKQKFEISHIIFLSKYDSFDEEQLTRTLRKILQQTTHSQVNLLVPYLIPPTYSQRLDGVGQSAVVPLGICPTVKFLFSCFR